MDGFAKMGGISQSLTGGYLVFGFYFMKHMIFIKNRAQTIKHLNL